MAWERGIEWPFGAWDRDILWIVPADPKGHTLGVAMSELGIHLASFLVTRTTVEFPNPFQEATHNGEREIFSMTISFV